MNDDKALGTLVLREAIEAYRRELRGRLLAAYALGSLAHGGFSALVSDVDVGLVVADPVQQGDDSRLSSIAEMVRGGSSPLHERLSVFWGTPLTLQGRSRGGRFPALDVLDLLQNGLLVFGADVRGDVQPPALRDLLVEGAEFALQFLGGGRQGSLVSALGSMKAGSDALAEIRDAALLVSRGPRRMTKLVLFPVRFVYTATTGEVGTNELAARFHLELADAPSRGLVAAALAWRREAPADLSDARALLRDGMIPLYTWYMDDHIPRLEQAGRDDLAVQFVAWRSALISG